MKPKQSINSHFALPSVIIITALGLSSAHAATFTWDGGSGDNNWSTAANWVGDVAPSSTAQNNVAVFTGTAPRLSPVNINSDFSLSSVIFDSTAASYNIGGSQRFKIVPSGNAITQNSANSQTISVNLTLDQGVNVALNGTGSGTLILSGTIGNRSSTNNATLTAGGTVNILVSGNIVDGTLGGSKLNSVTVNKQGGALTFTGSNTYTGGTSVNGGKLVLDYNTVTAGNRLSNTAAVGVNGGELQLLGDAAAATSEIIGAMNANAQGGKLTLLPGAGQSATFTAASLNRTATTSSILFRGANLGGNSGQYSQILFTGASGLVGAAGTAATPQLSIIPFVLGDTSATGTGTALVTYDGTVGVRLLNEATEYAAYASANTNDNAKFTAPGGNVTATTGGSATPSTINSLLLRNSSGSGMTVTINDGVNLAPISGTFLFRGDSTADTITLTKDTANLATGTINLAANTSANIFVTTDTTATINAPISFNTTGGLAKDGAGTLVINQNITQTGFATTSTGVIAINSGTLKAGAVDIVGIPRTDSANGFVSTVFVASGATFDINSFNQTFAGRGALGTAFGSIVTNTAANATLRPSGSGNAGGSPTVTQNGTFTDGTTGDGADTGLISLDIQSTTSSNGTMTSTFSHGGHTLNNILVRALGTDKAAANFNSLTTTDNNTIYGTITVMGQLGNSNSNATLTANALSNGTIVSKPLGDAPIVFTSSNNGASGGFNGALNINLSALSGTLDATTSTWLNDVTVTANSATNNTVTSKITLDRGDGLSTNFTHQLDSLLLTGITRKLDVTTNNGTTLEFTGTTTLHHTATTTNTITVSTGTLKLNGIVESGTGAKTLTKSGVGTLLVNGTASYTGATNVTGGTLKLGASGTLADTSGISVSAGATFDVTALASPFSLAAGKTLSGAGTVAGAAEVLGTVAPTAVPSGTLTTTNNLTVPGTLDIDFDAVGVAQVETATAVGTVDADGGDIVNVTVTGADISGSPLTIPVTVTAGDLPAAWAGTVRSALSGNAAITAFYTVGGSGAAITLTRNSGVANDGILNIALDNDVTLNPGITAAPTSTNSTAGVAKSNDLLVVGGALTLTNGTLDVSVVGSLTAPAYIIAKYDTLVGTFASEGTLPSGYTLNYAYNDGINTKNIALVQVGGVDPFDNWATTTHGLSGGNAEPDADPDQDGLDNAIEFVVGGLPNPATVGAMSAALAPTLTTDATNLIFTYRNSDLSATQTGISTTVEYGSNLTGWTTATHGVSGVTIVSTNDFYSVSPGVDRVVVTIPKSLAGGAEKLFARLKVIIP